MPNICAHLIFGAHIADAVKKPLASLGQEYFLGCLGPDWYFYDRLPPTPFTRNQKKHGNALHALDCEVLFSAMADAAGDSMRPFLYGFLTHIALDSTMHPYVEFEHVGNAHSRFEGVIDSVIYKETCDVFPYRDVFLAKADARPLDALLSRVSKDLLDANVSGAYVRGIRKFKRLVPLMYDPHNTRYRFMRRLERLFHKPGVVSDLLIGPDHEDLDDCMNVSRKKWTSPFNPGISGNDSVPMLFSKAGALAVAMIRAFDEGDSETLSGLLHNRTMQKGLLPC